MRKISILMIGMSIALLLGCSTNNGLSKESNDAIEKLTVVTNEMNEKAKDCDDCKLTSYYCDKHYKMANEILAKLESSN